MTAITAPAPTTASRARNVGLWTLQVLLAAVYAFSAFGKLTAEAQNVAGFQAMGLGNTGMYIIGCLELAGAIAMFVPRLTGLAALCFVALMTGAVVMTLAIGGRCAAIPATVGVVAAVVAWGRRDGAAPAGGLGSAAEPHRRRHDRQNGGLSRRCAAQAAVSSITGDPADRRGRSPSRPGYRGVVPMTAKYSTTCAVCAAGIQPGEEIGEGRQWLGAPGLCRRCRAGWCRREQRRPGQRSAEQRSAGAAQ